MRYRVVHRTSYTYESPVSQSWGEHRLLPRRTPTQHVVESSVAIDPAPDDRRERIDIHGNRVEHYTVHRDHEQLTVTASSIVDVMPPPAMVADRPWEQVRDAVRAAADPATREARAMLLDSPQVRTMTPLLRLARRAFTPGRPITEAYRALIRLVSEEFTFDAEATTVTTPLEEVLANRAGVCQDFAHLTIGALRTIGLPARYVSGYIETVPPPGTKRLQGADASHAWVSLYVPEHGWFDADPTNDQLVGTRHVSVAWGRDYGDVSPLKGVIYTEGPTERLDIAVDVIRIDDRTPAPWPRRIDTTTRAGVRVANDDTTTGA